MRKLAHFAFVLMLASPACARVIPAISESTHQAAASLDGDKLKHLLGIYEAAVVDETLPASIKAASMQPVILSLSAQAKQHFIEKPTLDPKDLCQVLGPFRMMALAGTKFEFLQDGPDKLVMLFAKSSWGHVRTISIGKEHSVDLGKVRPMWNGDSVALWQGDTLVVDTIHFTNRTWLNEDGVTNSKQLHLTERIRSLDGGRYLKYQAIAEDPEILAAPAVYTRYFKRTKQEIIEDNCFAKRQNSATK